METKERIELIASIDVWKEMKTNSNILNLDEQIEAAISHLKFLSNSVKLKKFLSEMEQHESDIYVQTLAKSGTTLTQMILYQMTTDGKMDFNHIYDVSPWIGETLKLKGEKLSAFKIKPPKNGQRRIIKSHSNYSFFEDIKKGKFVYVVRNAFDQLLSFYHHHKNYSNPDLKFEDFVSDGIIENWFKLNGDWLKNEGGLDIIYLNYEDIVGNKPDVVKRLAKFLDIELTDKDMERIIDRTSFSFMKKHQEKFGDQPEPKVDNKIYNQFIRKGKVGEGKDHFTKEQIEKYYELSKGFFENHKVTKRYFNPS